MDSINKIELQQLMPNVFAGLQLESEVWLSNLSFERGCSVLVEAQSGKGKSSMCSFLYGLRHDYSGTLTFDGQDVSLYTAAQWSHIRQHHLALLFQEHRLFAPLTTMENIQIKNQLTHYKTESEIRDLLVRVGLEDKIDVPVRILSLGQQQRVAFVRLLCQPADFFMLDEPVSHLDEYNSTLLGGILKEEVDRTGAGVIVTSIGKHLPYDYQRIIEL